MRDATIQAMHSANARRNALMFSRWEFINTRMMAFEEIMFNAPLFQKLKYLLSPKTLKNDVDRVHTLLMQESKRKAEEAAKKPKINIVGANGV